MRGHAAQIAASIPFSRQTTGRAGWHTAPMPTSATPTSIREALASDRTIDIITTGARTGQRRVTEIWFCRLDDVLVITGTPGPRDWYANLLRPPDFVFRLKEPARAELPARSTPVLDPGRRRSVFAHPATEWYRDRAGVEALVSGSPLVEVTLLHDR